MALDMATGYVCEICKMEHSTYSGFMKHVRLGCSDLRRMKSKGGSDCLSEGIACKICKKKFETYSSLREHIQQSCSFPRHKRKSEPEVRQGELEAHHEMSQESSTVNNKLLSPYKLKQLKVGAIQYMTSGDAKSSSHKKLVSDKLIYKKTRIHSLQPKNPHMTSNVLSSEMSYFRVSPTSMVQIQGHKIPSEGSVLDEVHADITPVKRKHMYVRCQVCEKVIKAVSFKAHTANHKADGRFQCFECKKFFKLQSYLQSHMRLHAKESKYECGLCAKKYKYSGSLVQHIRTVHAIENRFLCDVCGKLFARRTSFKTHMINHSSERQRHQCDICGNSLTSLGTLKSHMHIHTGTKPYKCSICGRGFRQGSNLETHFRIHTGEKPYKCHVCDKGFVCSDLLKHHLNIHTGEKPYKCEICGRGFAAPCNLRQHRKTHK